MDVIHKDLKAYINQMYPNNSLASINRMTHAFRTAYFQELYPSKTKQFEYNIKVNNFFEGQQIDDFMDVMFDAHTQYEVKKQAIKLVQDNTLLPINADYDPLI